VAGVEQATDMAWGEPGMTLRRARCPRTEGAGCVLRAIRTESGDMRCDGQEDRRTGTMLVTRACVHDSDVDRPLPRVTCNCLPGQVR
jgi:hypothetical protein